MHARTGFADGFTHASEGGARAGGVTTSICAVLLAEACNTGFEPLIRGDTPALGRSRLSWVRQNYVRAETLTRANAALVAAQNRIPLARAWGGGDVASADGLRFVVPVRTIHSGPNPRYFGQERGVTFYNLVSDQFTGLNGITVPGTLRDSLTLLSLVLEAICRELRVSRKTVRKVIRSEATDFQYQREQQPMPRLGAWRETLDALLASNEAKPGRERLTLIRLFETLGGLGYEGGYDAVRRYARAWERQQAATSVDAFVPLSFAPGEAYQFDWSHEVVLINGTTVTVKVAHLRLCHSRMLFARGMALGSWLRARVRPETFRLCFFVGLLALGGELVWRGLA